MISCFMPVSKLTPLLRQRDVSVRDVLEVQFDQIARHNPQINAIVTLDADGARARADALDAEGPRPDQSLWGVPITLKDAWEVAGMRSTAGYPPLADYVPSTDATVAARLRAAGAILIGKTNVPILSTDTQTHNEIFGLTVNPWNDERTPGGSSGGSAAAVAAGMSFLDIGSDIAGSVRIPAHFCGVYSLKTTEHRVSTAGHIPPLPESPRGVRRFSIAGPVARSIDDLEIALRVIAGPDPRQVDLPPVPLPDSVAVRPLGAMRVAWLDRFGPYPVSEDTARTMAEAAARLARQGAHVERRIPEGFDSPDLWELYGKLYWAVVGAGLTPEIDAAEAEYARFTPDSPDAFSRGAGQAIHASLRSFSQAMLVREAYVNALDRLLSDFDVLICPVSPTPAWPHIPHMSNVVVAGQLMNYFEAGTYYCIPFNLTGHPVVVIPAGISDDGLPIGLQIVGRRWDEIRLLALARQIDGVLNAYLQPPGL